jgi:hypothetical protein
MRPLATKIVMQIKFGEGPNIPRYWSRAGTYIWDQVDWMGTVRNDRRNNDTTSSQTQQIVENDLNFIKRVTSINPIYTFRNEEVFAVEMQASC